MSAAMGDERGRGAGAARVLATLLWAEAQERTTVEATVALETKCDRREAAAVNETGRDGRGECGTTVAVLCVSVL